MAMDSVERLIKGKEGTNVRSVNLAGVSRDALWLYPVWMEEVHVTVSCGSCLMHVQQHFSAHAAATSESRQHMLVHFDPYHAVC
eukprot:2723682-Rhodomonas_salina.2